jgi:hypothetical protein
MATAIAWRPADVSRPESGRWARDFTTVKNVGDPLAIGAPPTISRTSRMASASRTHSPAAGILPAIT